MHKFRGITALFLFCLITLSHEIVATASAGDARHQNVENKREKSSAMEMATNIYYLITRSSVSSWDRAKSYINEVQTILFPPDLDFRKRYDAQSSSGDGKTDGSGESMKEAAEKSFETSKMVVEESAKSAAHAVGEAVHKTAEKVKESASDKDDSKAEL